MTSRENLKSRIEEETGATIKLDVDQNENEETRDVLTSYDPISMSVLERPNFICSTTTFGFIVETSHN